jgi:diguanylate cyclase
VSRLGGDEFVVASRGVNDARSGERIAAAICREVSKPFVMAGHSVETSASVGVVLTGAAGAAGVALTAEAGSEALADDPLCLADAAMYEAKRAGRNTWRVAPGAESLAEIGL